MKALLILLLSSAAALANPKPNVVIVYVDDMGWSDLTCFGGDDAKTPNIDRLAKEGIRFERFYVNAPICSPSRCALITGQYPQRWNVTSYLSNRSENEKRGMVQWLDPSAPTLPAMLKEAGYATGHFGKWHLGGQRDVGEAPLLTEYGIDRSLVNFEGLGDRLLGLGYRSRDEKPVRHDLGSAKLGRGEIRWVDRSKLTKGFVDGALDFIITATADKKPFFINVWPDDVHSPFFPPLEKTVGDTKRDRYLAVLENMDAQLAPLFDHLREEPALRENTIIIFCSDNGPEPGAGSSLPLYGSKGSLFEGGIRSPLIVWAPGFIAKDSQGKTDSKSILAAFDITPSLLALCDVKPSSGYQFDGEDRSKEFTGKSESARKQPIFWKRPPDRKRLPWASKPLPDLAVIDGKWKLLCDEDGGRAHLHDLEKDPSEKENLSEIHPDIVKQLSDQAMEWNRFVTTSLQK